MGDSPTKTGDMLVRRFVPIVRRFAPRLGLPPQRQRQWRFGEADGRGAGAQGVGGDGPAVAGESSGELIAHLVYELVLLTHWDSVICMVTAERSGLRRRGGAWRHSSRLAVHAGVCRPLPLARASHSRDRCAGADARRSRSSRHLAQVAR